MVIRDDLGIRVFTEEVLTKRKAATTRLQSNYSQHKSRT